MAKRAARRIHLVGGTRHGHEIMESEVSGGVYWAHSAVPPYWQEYRMTDMKHETGKGETCPIYSFTGKQCEKL